MMNGKYHENKRRNQIIIVRDFQSIERKVKKQSKTNCMHILIKITTNIE